MKRKGNAIVSIIILAGMAVFSGYQLLHSENLFPENNLWEQDQSTSFIPQSHSEDYSLPDAIIDQYNIPNMSNMAFTNRDLFIQKPGKTVKMHQAIDCLELEYIANSITITKKALLNSNQYTGSPMVKMDKDYNILNEYSYFMVNITVENTTDRVIDRYLNSLRLYCISNDNRLSENDGTEMFAYDGTDKISKAFYCYSFSPGEKKNFNIVFYILDDTIANLKLATLIYEPGGHPVSPDVRFIDLLED